MQVHTCAPFRLAVSPMENAPSDDYLTDIHARHYHADKHSRKTPDVCMLECKPGRMSTTGDGCNIQ